MQATKINTSVEYLDVFISYLFKNSSMLQIMKTDLVYSNYLQLTSYNFQIECQEILEQRNLPKTNTTIRTFSLNPTLRRMNLYKQS